MKTKASFEENFSSWRTEARKLLLAGYGPHQVDWNLEQSNLFESFDCETPRPLNPNQLHVSKRFLDLAEAVSAARVESRWDLLYRILYRLTHENRNLLSIVVDDDVHQAMNLEKSVRRDIHKMHAFVRFKEFDGRYVAWHKPEHLTVPLGTPFFVRRFGDKPWSIFTPDLSAHWDLKDLKFGKGMEQHEFEHQDHFDDLWKTYYSSIFNPARIKIKMMKAEMAPKYWSSMPETALIAKLVREAPQRLQNMAEQEKFLAQPPKKLNWLNLQEGIRNCKACPLFRAVDGAVREGQCGQGSSNAKVMIVHEKPLTSTDQAFLVQLLKDSDLVNEAVYITPAVKHSAERVRGVHAHACKPWLESEVKLVQPEVIIALGKTAGTAVLGRLPKIRDERNKILSNTVFAPKVILSWEIEPQTNQHSADIRRDLVNDFQLAKVARKEVARIMESAPDWL